MTTDADAPKVPGYRITGPVRSAGAGRTFRALRARDGLPVLVRVLSGAPGPGGIFGGSAGGPGAPFAVSPQAPPGSAAALLARGERLGAADAVRAGAALASGLAPLHAAGWVHHGIHPRTVLLSGPGARLDPDADPPLPAGVPFPPRALDRDLRDHLPPEAWAGRPATPAADVYRVAAVLWALLTGRVPPAAEPRGAAEEAGDPLGPDVPADLAEVLYRALDPDPARRPAHAGALAEALTAVARAHGWAPEAAEGDEGTEGGGAAESAEAAAGGAPSAPPSASAPRPGAGGPAAGAAASAAAGTAPPPPAADTAADAAEPGVYSPRAAETAAHRRRAGAGADGTADAEDEGEGEGEETGVYSPPDPAPPAGEEAAEPDTPGGAFAEPGSEKSERVVYFEEESERAAGNWTAPVWTRWSGEGGGTPPARADNVWGGAPQQARPDPTAAAAVRRAQWAAERAAEERAEGEDEDGRDGRADRAADDRDGGDGGVGDGRGDTAQLSPDEPFLGYRALPGAAHGAPLPLASPTEPARGPADRVVLVAALAVAVAAAAVALAVAAVVLVLGDDEESGEGGSAGGGAEASQQADSSAGTDRPQGSGDAGGEGDAGESGNAGESDGSAEPDRPQDQGGAPRPPADVEIAEDTEVSVLLTWRGHDADDVYNIMGGPEGEPSVLLADTRPPAEEVELVGLNPDVDYCFTVVAVVSGEETESSEEVCTNRFDGEERPE
ncbi:hypothetical protein LG943_04975 [Streptomonospora sp. S1-112]|uniref:non-specific serine/threonine protein kinase n=1 Tax=Streptomonospora mangrovi TaxID=2883123 RepID=A0A9X3NHT7_9ACTN|nr:hypothetical protein [Streptomonospora mangrovi]MDA0563687.1 hypothetical protein [Streptomonospora mangrovi]